MYNDWKVSPFDFGQCQKLTAITNSEEETYREIELWQQNWLGFYLRVWLANSEESKQNSGLFSSDINLAYKYRKIDSSGEW